MNKMKVYSSVNNQKIPEYLNSNLVVDTRVLAQVKRVLEVCMQSQSSDGAVCVSLPKSKMEM